MQRFSTPEKLDDHPKIRLQKLHHCHSNKTLNNPNNNNTIREEKEEDTDGKKYYLEDSSCPTIDDENSFEDVNEVKISKKFAFTKSYSQS